MKITKHSLQDKHLLTSTWIKALQLCNESVPTKAYETLMQVTKSFVDLGMPEQAARLLIEGDQPKQAIEVLVQAKMFDKATAVAQQQMPHMVSYVQDMSSQQGSSTSGNSTGRGMGTGLSASVAGGEGANTDAQAEVYAKNGQWGKVLELALKQGGPNSEAVWKYAAAHSSSLAKDGKYKQALSLLRQHGVLLTADMLPVYKRIAQEVLHMSEENPLEPESKGSQVLDAEYGAFAETFSALREVLYTLVQSVKGEEAKHAHLASHAQFVDLERLLLVAHYTAMRYAARRAGLKLVSAKAAVSLLRYVQDLPVDKAFLDAGISCTHVGGEFLSNAFVYLNRFVDLSDVIDDPDNVNIDNSDFVDTDIPLPYDVQMPSRHACSEKGVEEIREWVLEKALELSTQTLAQRNCEHCGKKTYFAALTCHACKATAESCCVTGFPVSKKANTYVQCKACQRPAHRNDWNMWVEKMKVCPWCSSVQKPNY